MENYFYLLLLIACIVFLIFVITLRNKKDKEIMAYHKENHDKNSALIEQSQKHQIEQSQKHQIRMIELLENISESLKK